jgi:hypothetical protein
VIGALLMDTIKVSQPREMVREKILRSKQNSKLKKIIKEM